MTDSNPVTQLRLIVETEDFDAALAFYRDALGLSEQESFEGEGGARVSILTVPLATLELSNPAQIRLIDDVEVGKPSSRPYQLSIRVAFEVADTAAMTDRLESAGATVVAPPTETPWRSLNSRLEAPGGLQITAFQELDTLEERKAKAGFGTSDAR
ncbi:MAG: putative lactoylglutathione lyase [Rhodoglobus sp.]|nr:putative lactoylglutathione lyase [Rhodoglobus sp.]